MQNETCIHISGLDKDRAFVENQGEHREGASYLIIILVHAGIISLKDEFLLKVHVTFVLDVFREPLFWAIKHKGTKSKPLNNASTYS